MPATKVQQATSTGAAPALNGVVQGNFVYLFSHAFRSASVTAETAATDSNGTVTTQDRLAVASGPDGILAAAYYVPNANAGTHTFTCQNFGAGAQERAVFEFSGVEQSANPLDVKTSNSTTVAGATSVATGTTGATGQADELILVGATLGGSPGVLNVGWTDPIAGFTSLAKFSNDSTDIAGLTNFKNVAATGTQTATFNWTDNTATPQGAIALIGAYRNALSSSISPLQSAKPRMIVRQHVDYDSIPQASNLYQPLAPVDNAPQPTGGTDISPLSSAKPKVIKFPPTRGPMLAHSEIATGQAVATSAWSSQGDSSASWTGSSTAASAWSSSGDATATWIGASLAASVWSASGDGTATWIGSALSKGVWSSTGDSTAAWIGAARGAGVWNASGDSTASWTGSSTAVSVWSSSGDSSASWTGGSLAAGVWSATGDSSAAWVGTSGGNVWSAAGDSVAQWVGAANALSIWTANGDSLALFVGTFTVEGGNELGVKPLGQGFRKRKPRHVPAKLKDQHPDDIERERRMLEEYIATLKPQRALRGKASPVPKAVTPAPVVTPRLSEAMASLATMQELARISRANQVAEEDRRKAERERQRRRAVAVLLMMLF